MSTDDGGRDDETSARTEAEIRTIVADELRAQQSNSTRRGVLKALGLGGAAAALGGTAGAQTGGGGGGGASLDVGSTTANTYRIAGNRYGGAAAARSELTSELGGSDAGARFAADDTGAEYYWTGSAWEQLPVEAPAINAEQEDVGDTALGLGVPAAALRHRDATGDVVFQQPDDSTGVRFEIYDEDDNLFARWDHQRHDGASDRDVHLSALNNAETGLEVRLDIGIGKHADEGGKVRWKNTHDLRIEADGASAAAEDAELGLRIGAPGGQGRIKWYDETTTDQRTLQYAEASDELQFLDADRNIDLIIDSNGLLDTNGTGGVRRLDDAGQNQWFRGKNNIVELGVDSTLRFSSNLRDASGNNHILLNDGGDTEFRQRLDVGSIGTFSSDAMTANPESDTEDGYVTVTDGTSAFQIPMYEA